MNSGSLSEHQIDIVSSLQCFRDELSKEDFNPAELARGTNQVNFFQGIPDILALIEYRMNSRAPDPELCANLQ